MIQAEPTLASCLYEGLVQHRRFTPRAHSFRYKILYLYLDLAEVEHVFARRWLWSTQRGAVARWRRADHLGDPAQPLDLEVRALVERETGQRPAGPIRLLTLPRNFGYGFNPVSFFYCWDASGGVLEAIVAEVNNTPWRERHPYVLDCRNAESASSQLSWRFDKAFHVSPFMPMDVQYDWRFTTPGESLVVHMENEIGGVRAFDATMTLRRRAIDGRSLASALVRQPLAGLRVMTAIHWQALRLWLKRTPFHDHPEWKT